MLAFSRLGKIGRLGNHLFQIAFITSFAEKHNLTYCLPYWEYAGYFDHNFNFSDSIEQINFDLQLKEPGLGYHEKYFEDKVPFFKCNNVDIVGGYFQSYKYFTREHVQKTFRSKLFSDLDFDRNKCVAISVRRGDFVRHPHYNNIEAEQFRELLKKFKRHKVFVFSDDYMYCAQEFIGSQYEFASGLTDIQQLLLMRTFKKFILSNSTFSYWGAMLSKEPETVLYPEFMFPDLDRCRLYNRDYWPADAYYQRYTNPINKTISGI